MNKRKADSVAYTGSDTFGGNLKVEVANWESRVAVDVAREPQLGVAANYCLRLIADVARKPQLGVATNCCPRLAADVAGRSRQGVVTNGEPRVTADVAEVPQFVAANCWTETVSEDVGDSSTQATTEGATEPRPLYTDFWALLADAGYEAW